jgi:glycine oxidase
VSAAAVDVAVVGAGIVGCSVAWECARRGAAVALVETGAPGGQASGAAAGMLAPASEAHGPGAFLDLGMASLAMWPEFAARLVEDSGRDVDLALDGLLRVAIDATDAVAVRGRLVWQLDAGIDAEWLDAVASRERDPALSVAAVGAAWYPREGHVDSPATVAALVAALRSAGASVLTGTRAQGWAPGGGLRLSDGGTVEAAVVVIAAGAWSGRIAATLGARALPIGPVRGQLLALEGVRPVPRRVLFGGLLGYAVGKRDGSVLVGATEEDAGFDATPTRAATEHLRGVARALLASGAAATRESAWAGLRPRTPDALPVLGELDAGTSRARLLIASGHHRNGVLLAPVTAAGIARLALEGSAPAGWEPFSPERFSSPRPARARER